MHHETVVSVSRMRALDHHAIASGVPGRLLMEVAGHGAFRFLSRVRTSDQPITILTGGGNNAGDGFVVARYCAAAGMSCQVLAVAPVDSLPDGDTRKNASLLEAFSVPVATCDPEALVRCLADSDIVVDGLLGTGLSGDVREPYRAVISALNGSKRPVLSLDIPSGLCGDSGHVLGSAVHARWTVTFGARKQGLLIGDGPAHTGEVTVVPLPFPPDAWTTSP
ncbi:MAG: NAD(P)H-hydrate epimerase [Planctomycetes bacterium]|nr:NAD(P)H-hydrate epimerase [Planctomycetota bacterium]